MSFTSVVFIFFFLPAFIMGAYALKGTNIKIQNFFLWILSILFYGWCGIEYLVLLFAGILINYMIGWQLERHQKSTEIKKIYFVCGIVLNVGVLGVCKYFHFFMDTIQSVVQVVDPQFSVYQPNIPLPLGISFIIFQLIAYLADVYKGKIVHEKDFMEFSLYVFFFPKVVMGPITRYEDLQSALKARKFSMDAWNLGLKRFCFGFVKKMLLANKMAVLADAVFSIQGGQNFVIAWVGAIAYTLQIYIDFSSYSDMAIGLAGMVGFDIPENFNYPYISTSIQEFWRRWHISLNAWFRDYLYIPLGGNRTGKIKLYRNLGIVFLLTGLWHGANWTFIVWGIFHGIFSMLERTKWGEILGKIPKILRHMYTLLVVIVGWVFFRADSLLEAIQFIASMFTFRLGNLWQITFWEEITAETVIFMLIAIMICIPRKKIRIKKEWIQQCALAVLVLFSIYSLLVNDFSPFIYLKF